MHTPLVRCPVLTLIALAGLAAAALGAVRLSAGQSPAKPATATAAPNSSAASSLQELGFLAGAWRGDMAGGLSEEVWSEPSGSSIMGCFRWLKEDCSPRMFEMLTITREGDATLLRLRHYTPTLNAKEEADKPLTLSLKESGPGRAVFAAGKGEAGDLSGVRYELREGALHITVEFGNSEKQREPLIFSLQRSGR